MRPQIPAVRVFIGCVALLLLFMAPTSASASTSGSPEKSGSGHFAPLPAGGGGVIANGVSGVITAGTCKYRQAADNAHYSTGDASVHGYWVKVAGPCPTLANVDVYLQAWWCTGDDECGWLTVASDSRDVTPGPGSGKWAIARNACSDSRAVGYRGVTDVDLKDWSDPSGYYYGDAVDVACYPST